MDVDERIEAAMGDFFWVPDDVTIVDRAAIKYSSCARDDKILNSAVRVRAAGTEADVLVDEMSAAHAGRASRWFLSPISLRVPGLVGALERAGYTEALASRCAGYAIEPDAYDRAVPTDVAIERIETPKALRAAMKIHTEVFDLAEQEISASEIARQLSQCSGPGARVARFLARIDGEPIAQGGMTLFPAYGIGFLWSGGVREAWRGRGAYTALLAARMECARCAGIGRVGLYAREATSAPIVAAHGFERFGEARQWDRAAS